MSNPAALAAVKHGVRDCECASELLPVSLQQEISSTQRFSDIMGAMNKTGYR